MIRDYNYFGFHPQYSCKLYYDEKLVKTASYLSGTEPCFREVFHYFYGMSRIYKGIYKLQCNKEFRTGSGNYCSLNKTHIMKIIRYMRNSLDVNIKLTDTPDKYIFDIEIIGRPIKHKWILTFCRVFYEWPYNEMAVDVFRIREAKTLSGIDITHKSFLELYNLTISAYKCYIGAEQSLFKNLGVDLTGKELKRKFDTNTTRVQFVCDFDKSNALYDLLEKHYSDSYRKVDLEKTFPKRLELYSKNYEIIKNFKKDEQKGKKDIRRRTSKVIC